MNTFTAGLLFAVISTPSVQADAVITPDLAALGRDQAGWEVPAQRPFLVAVDATDGNTAVQANPVALAYVAGLEMADGVREFAVRGRAGDQSSFVRVIFHGVDGDEYEVVYFRSFNFGQENPLKRRHAVQYIAHPDWPWHRLRRERTDQFEKPVRPEPKPDEWFQARVVIENGRIRAYVNNAPEASLDVVWLSARRTGKVGVWFSGYGDIANLRITPKRN